MTRRVQPRMFDLAWPLIDGGAAVMRSNFAVARGEGTRSHKGIDLEVARGTPILATVTGTVVRSTHGQRRGTEREGHYMIIRDEDGFDHLFAHMNAPPLWARGSWVARRAYLGQVGTSGDAIGPHLHYQITRGATAFDPYPSLQYARDYIDEDV